VSGAATVGGDFEVAWTDCLLGEIAATRKEKAVPTLGTTCVELEHIEPKTGRLLGCDKSGTQSSIKTAFSRGDILFGKLRPYLRKYAVAPFDGICTTEVLAIYPQDEAADKRFLFYLMQGDSVFEIVESLSYGTKMPRVSWTDLAEIEVALPPFPEQQKIAAILTAVDDKLDVIARQISATQTLKQGLMQTLFTHGAGTPDPQGRWHPHTEFQDTELGRIPVGWQVVAQTDVVTFYNGRAYKLTEWEKSGVPVIRLQNLTGSGDRFYYSNLELPAHQYVHNGDLLYMWSASFGPYIWGGEKAIYHYHIWKVECSARIDQRYMYYALVGLTQNMQNQTNGSTMMHLTKAGMEKHTIALPPLAEQQEIASILTSVDNKLSTLATKQTRYQSLKRGLMQKLLTGQWRVRASTAVANLI
jgi:type I restriction enzyme, S subunit